MYFNTNIHVHFIHVTTEAQRCLCVFELFVVYFLCTTHTVYFSVLPELLTVTKP